MDAMLARSAVPHGRPDLDGGLGGAGKVGFLAAILVAIGYVAHSVHADASAAGVHATAILPYALLFSPLLIAAICWNLLTWLFGIPASSSHTLIGSIIGVANSLIERRSGTGGVDWGQAPSVAAS